MVKREYICLDCGGEISVVPWPYGEKDYICLKETAENNDMVVFKSVDRVKIVGVDK